MVYDRHLEFSDLNGNLRTLDYDACNIHEEAEGRVLQDSNYKIKGSEITGVKVVFDQPWSKAEFEKLMKTDVTEGKRNTLGYRIYKDEGEKVQSFLIQKKCML